MGQLVLDRVKIMPCKRCINGQVMLFKDGRWTCTNCGQEHTPAGELEAPRLADENTLIPDTARFYGKTYEYSEP